MLALRVFVYNLYIDAYVTILVNALMNAAVLFFCLTLKPHCIVQMILFQYTVISGDTAAVVVAVSCTATTLVTIIFCIKLGKRRASISNEEVSDCVFVAFIALQTDTIQYILILYNK